LRGKPIELGTRTSSHMRSTKRLQHDCLSCWPSAASMWTSNCLRSSGGVRVWPRPSWAC